jgi:DNA-binding NarL/FixJ family response regulator
MKEIRVIVIDDQSLIREGLVSVLACQSDLRIVGQSANNADAITALQHENSDIILFSQSNPSVDIAETIKRFRQTSPKTNILILASSAAPEPMAHAIRAGAIGYIMKNTNWEQLLQAIHDVSAGRSNIDPVIAHEYIRSLQEDHRPANAPNSVKLTERERQTLALLAQGLSNQEIADAMQLHVRTIAKYVGILLSKLKLDNRTQVALYAKQAGITGQNPSAQSN